MELKISKIAFINEMKAHAFDMVADPNVCNDKAAVLKAFIYTMDCVLCREEKKPSKSVRCMDSSGNTDDAFNEFISDLKEIGIDAEV